MLSDLLRVDTEQPDKLETVDNRNDIINFYKIRRQYDVVQPLLQYRRVSYPYLTFFRFLFALYLIFL